MKSGRLVELCRGMGLFILEVGSEVSMKNKGEQGIADCDIDFMKSQSDLITVSFTITKNNGASTYSKISFRLAEKFNDKKFAAGTLEVEPTALVIDNRPISVHAEMSALPPETARLFLYMKHLVNGYTPIATEAFKAAVIPIEEAHEIRAKKSHKPQR
jgi:hypothetical protein